MNSKEYVKIEYEKQDGSAEEVIVDVVRRDGTCAEEWIQLAVKKLKENLGDAITIVKSTHLTYNVDFLRCDFCCSNYAPRNV